MELTTKQIEAAIVETVGRVHGYFDWRAQQWLGLQLPNLPEKYYAHTPLALSLRAIFDHITGVAPTPETIRDSCQLVCEALFVAPGTTGGGYEIPAEFWTTTLGEAIQEAIGVRPDLSEDAIVETAIACQITGVSRVALQQWRESGRIVPVDQAGQTGGFRYRVGDLRRVAK